ncbi:MAG: VOC family protein [Chloroflexota bacterium]|nr:VOC family protein [Chloroflexota bacterium]
MTSPDASPPSTAIDRGIYVMPQFVTFEVSDMAAARRWYVNGLGFVELAVLPGPDGDPVLVHLRRFRYQDVLLVPGRDPEEKASGVRVSFAAGDEDLDARAASASGESGGVVEGPTSTPWNTRDLHFQDADGHLVVFTQPDLNVDMDSEFAQRVRDSVQTTD